MANTGQDGLSKVPEGILSLAPTILVWTVDSPGLSHWFKNGSTAVLLWYIFGTFTPKPLQYGGPNNTRKLSARNLSLRISKLYKTAGT